MASSAMNLKHIRSISLPSNSYPLTQKVEEQLCRLKASEATSSSSSSICSYLSGLNGLYSCVHDLVQLSLTREKWVDEMLEGSLRLVDACGTVRDVLSQMMENVRNLQSALRRRSTDSNEIATYMTSRKKMSKEIRKCVQSLKKAENKREFALLSNDRDVVAMVRVVREVEELTISMFESLLAFVSIPKTLSNWSLVSKLRRANRVACEDEQANKSEMEQVDVALKVIVANKSCKGLEGVHVQNALKGLELSLNDLEGGLESTFKHLIKIRVSLLNALNKSF